MLLLGPVPRGNVEVNYVTATGDLLAEDPVTKKAALLGSVGQWPTVSPRSSTGCTPPTVGSAGTRCPG